MSLKNLNIFLIVCLSLSCSKSVEPNKFESLADSERDSLATKYHNWSDYFLQPSYLYRLYKDSALIVQPNNVDYRQRLSYSYKKVGEHVKAMEVLNKAVEIDLSNNKVDAIQYRAWSLLYYYRDYKGALEDIALIEKRTSDSYSQCWGEPCSFQKAQALYKTEDYQQAISVMNELILEEKERFNDISNHLYFFYIARCYTKLGDYRNAESFYKKSIELYENFTEGYFYLGEVYQKVGNERQALEMFQKSYSLKGYKIEESYIERFDEVFPYMIEEKLKLFNTSKSL